MGYRPDHRAFKTWTGTLSKRGLAPVPTSVTVIAVTFLDNGTGINPGDLAGPNSVYAVDYTVYRSWFLGNHDGLGGLIGDMTVNVSGATFRDNQVAVISKRIPTPYPAISPWPIPKSATIWSAFRAEAHPATCFATASPGITAVATDSYYTYVVMTANTVTGSYIAVHLTRNADSELVGNTFTGNKTAVSYDEGGGSVVDNVFSGNGTALTMTDADNAGNGDQYWPIPVTGNRISNNTRDGIVISGRQAKLKDNISTFNHGWGIDAPGATDLGGNRAFGNYHSPQCVGVVCTH